MKHVGIILSVLFLLGVIVAGLVLSSEPNDSPVVAPSSADAFAPEQPTDLESVDVDSPVELVGSGERTPEVASTEREVIEEARTLALEIVHADETPAFGALVILVSPDAILGSGRTDNAGRIDFAADLARAQVVVAGASSRPHREPVPNGSSELRIVLDEGAVLSGVVRIDGEPPEEPLELTLSPADWNIVYLPENWRDQVPEASYRSQASQDTGADGAFHFSAMRFNWSGEIELDEAHVLAEGGGSSFDVDRPRTGQVIHLTRKPALSGRVLDPQGMTVVAGANVKYELRGADGSVASVVETGADGRFRIPIDEEGPMSASLEIYTDEGVGRRHVEVETVDVDFGTDVGDIFLEATRDIPFIAVEIDGRPIAGAIASIGDEDNRFASEPTDEEGLGVLKGLLPEVRSMEVFGLLHSEVTVTLPPVVTEPLRVVLDPCSILEILVHNAAGEPLPECVVKVRSHDGALFAGDVPSRVRDERISMGASGSFGSSTSHFSGRVLSSSSEYRTDDEGRVLLPGLDPETELSFAVSDAVGYVVAERHGVVVRKGERRVVELEVDREARSFVGVLKGADGELITGEAVRVQSSSKLAEKSQMRERLRVETDDVGEFVIDDLFAERLDLRIDHDDHAVLLAKDVVVPEDGSAVELWLEKPETVRLNVVDANGDPFSGGSIRVLALDETLGRPRRIEDGQYDLVKLPSQTLSVELEVGGRTFTRSFDPREESVTLEIPASVRVEVAWSLLELPESYHVVSLEREADDEAITQWFSPKNAKLEGEHVFETVFPGTYVASMAVRHPVDGEHVELVKRQTVVVAGDADIQVLLTP